MILRKSYLTVLPTKSYLMFIKKYFKIILTNKIISRLYHVMIKISKKSYLTTNDNHSYIVNHISLTRLVKKMFVGNVNYIRITPFFQTWPWHYTWLEGNLHLYHSRIDVRYDFFIFISTICSKYDFPLC